jgi:predicted nucleic acid-binding protein
MIVLDTDTFSLLASGHPLVAARFRAAADQVTITVVTRIEALEGRFAFVFRAADGEELQRAQKWLLKTEADLTLFPHLLFK